MEEERIRSRSRSLLASVENVDFKRFKREDHALENYSWHKPEKSIPERKEQTDTRRDELLGLLYQDSINAGQAEEMIKEWISLVVERDRLLRQQLDKENKVEYLCQLRQLLKDQPPLGEASEEVGIREALLSLEHRVSQYCQKHHIPSPPSSKVQLKSTRQGRSLPSSDASLHKASRVQPDMLDHETGQTRIPIISPTNEENDGPHCCSMQRSTSKSPPPTQCAGRETCVPSDSRHLPSCAPDVFSRLTFPPIPPAPSIQPPSSVSVTVPGAVAHITASGPDCARGATGTVQFAGSNHMSVPLSGADILDTREKIRNKIPCDDSVRSSAAVMDHSDPPLECPLTGDRRNLLDEIASSGQAILRRTSRPKSPGGTPVKHSRNRLTLTGNTDVLQRALINKFRSLHSTPIRHPSPSGGGVGDRSGSFDLSSAWSDINGSCTVYEDPDMSSTPPSTLGASNNSGLARRETECRPALEVVDPNSSTAV